MDAKSALEIVEKYLEGNGQNEQYQNALDYLAGQANRAGELQQELTKPGQLFCEQAQELMPYYYDTVARQQLSTTEQANFLLHLNGCLNCAEEYQMLARFEDDFEFAQASNLKIPTRLTELPPKPASHIQKVIDTVSKLKILLKFSYSPAVAESATPYNPSPKDDDKITIFSDAITAQFPVTVTVQAERISATSCDLSVQLKDNPNLAGQNITLSYLDKRQSALTDEKGCARFASVPIEVLPQITLEIEVSGQGAK